MHGLTVYVTEGLPLAQDLSLEKFLQNFTCFRLALLHSVSYSFFFYQSLSSSLCTFLILLHLTQMKFSQSTHLLMLLSLTSIIRTGLPILVEQIDLINSAIISNDLIQVVNFPTWIPVCHSHSPALLNLFLWSDASIYSIMAFSPQGNSDQVAVSVFIDFTSNSHQDSLFHRIDHDNSSTDWGGRCDHLRDVPWEVIFQIRASAAAREFCEWVQVQIDVYIPHRKYQVKPHSSPWFPAACSAAVAHRNHCFVCTKRINLLLLN